MKPKPIKILLVEDDEREVQEFKDYMEGMTKYVLVGVADNTKDGMQLFIDNKPDIIVLDFTLKGSIGSSLIKNIRSTDLPIQPFILVLSLSITSWQKDVLMEMGANEFIIKGAYFENPPIIFDFIKDFYDGYLKRATQEAKVGKLDNDLYVIPPEREEHINYANKHMSWRLRFYEKILSAMKWKGHFQ